MENWSIHMKKSTQRRNRANLPAALAAGVVILCAQLAALADDDPKAGIRQLDQRIKQAKTLSNEAAAIRLRAQKNQLESRTDIGQARNLQANASSLQHKIGVLQGPVSPSQYQALVSEYEKHLQDFNLHLQHYQQVLIASRANQDAYQEHVARYQQHCDLYHHETLPALPGPMSVVTNYRAAVGHACGGLHTAEETVRATQTALRQDQERALGEERRLYDTETALQKAAQARLDAARTALTMLPESDPRNGTRVVALPEQYKALQAESKLLEGERGRLLEVSAKLQTKLPKRAEDVQAQ